MPAEKYISTFLSLNWGFSEVHSWEISIDSTMEQNGECVGYYWKFQKPSRMLAIFLAIIFYSEVLEEYNQKHNFSSIQ